MDNYISRQYWRRLPIEHPSVVLETDENILALEGTESKAKKCALSQLAKGSVQFVQINETTTFNSFPREISSCSMSKNHTSYI